ncbi:tumor necrosis factor alpha-induced protein 2 isoform X2 [Mastacembelus armatus]|nr:tumor necrosis factor alpha-induced protein 2 isoform X2 [Mastacembelus armatus]
MRTHSDSVETDGSKYNIFSRLWKRGQNGVNNNQPTTDGAHPPGDEDPPKVTITFEQNLNQCHLHEASQMLIQREERLFEASTGEDTLKHHEEEENKLAADYRDLQSLVRQSLLQSLSLSSGDANVEALRSAVDAICLEEKQDQLWKKRHQTIPAWRCNSWKELHDSTLRVLVTERMDNPSTPPAELTEQSSVQADIHSMGRQLKEDLLTVVEVVKSCYPPEMDICNFYARMYHQIFSARFRKIADFGLGDKDCTFLLRWVNEYYPQILQKPQLASNICTEELGKLLPQTLLDPLEEQYLTRQQNELMTYTNRVLEDAEQKWKNGEEPEREYGSYVSPVAYDIIQLINGMVTSAAKVVGDLHKARSITCQLTGSMQRFRSLQDNIIKQDRANSKAIIKSYLGCIEQFRDVLVNKSHLFPEDVRTNCLCVLDDTKQSAHVYLLNPVHGVLKPLYKKLGTSDWLNKTLFENLLISIEREIQDVQGSTESCHQELISQFHQEVTVEYVKRLLKGNVKLKDKDLQLRAYMTVKDNAESLHDLLSRMGSREVWLKEVLTSIGEVLKIQDLAAIQIHFALLGSAFPDLSTKHVSALLKLKTNISKEARKVVKDSLSDTLNGTGVGKAPLFFSKVQVK